MTTTRRLIRHDVHRPLCDRNWSSDNGYTPIAASSGSDDHVKDSYWQLYDEVGGGGKKNRSIAIRFVASGDFDGEHKEVEFAGFLDVTDDKLNEIRFVTDMTVFNDMRQAAGLDPLQ